MMSILTLSVMIILVVTMRSTGGKRSARAAKPSKKQGDTLILGRGVRVGPPERDPQNPGVVSYRLLDGKKLPSATQRALRRIGRPFGRASTWINRRFSLKKVDDATIATRRSTGESVELQNFLEARNREIARRKSEDPSKRGPEDTLH